MLVTFRSTATESVTMFGDVAMQLLKMMGASGHIPGAFNAEDVPSALQRLETSIERIKAEQHAATPARPADNEDWASDEDEKTGERERPVEIATRAVPLLSMMKRAAAAKAEVVWEGK